MNIQPVYSSVSPAAVTGVQSATDVAGSAPTAIASSVGPATTWWVSPPGVFFSLLHQISQQYPEELKVALEQFAEGLGGGAAAGSGAAGPDGQTQVLLAAEVAHIAQPVRRRATAGAVSFAPATVHAPTETNGATVAAPTSSIGALVGTLQKLAHRNPAVLVAISGGLAASFEGVASAATGPGARAMADLAMQLRQAAQMGGPPSPYVPEGEHPDPEPVSPVAAVDETEGDGSLVDEASKPRPLHHSRMG